MTSGNTSGSTSHNPDNEPRDDIPVYKRPAFWAISAAGLGVVTVGAILIGNGLTDAASSLSESPTACAPGSEDPSCAPKTTSAPRTTEAPITSAVPTTSAPATTETTAAPTSTASSPSRTTASPTPTSAAPTSSSQAAPAPAPQTAFAINCDADPGYCGPDGGAPVTNSPFLGAYALNANSGGDVGTGVHYPHGNEILTPFCKGSVGSTEYVMVFTNTPYVWAEPNGSGSGEPYSGYVESAVLPGAAAAVAACTSFQDYSSRLN